MDEYPKMSDFLPTEEELKARKTWTMVWDAARLCIAFGVGTVVGVVAQKCLTNKN